MKKLLLLNNLLLILSFGKCGGDSSTQTDGVTNAPDTLSMIVDSNSIDTTYTGMITDSVGQSTAGDTISKDSKYNTHTHNPKEAPKHNAPDQAKIDSIKAAKAKKKKD